MTMGWCIAVLTTSNKQLKLGKGTKEQLVL